ncbi:TonB family protein [Novosphingobium sp. G106]|uniref:TonB family protein n=1 Tax=Novosphingobium sp. G106 TaxID=2849500 RepID=UPI001C2DC9E8|nr:TonB family protein [Novosphingobium sp. G106]MBV1688700.1 TonB family protein [Novosphingobium sp. G106]
MTRADISSPRGTRLGVALAVAALHIALVLALVRAFAPEFTARVADQVFSTLTVTVTSPPPQPKSPTTKPTAQAPLAAGAAAEAGRHDEATPIAAPTPRIVIATQPAPSVAGQGRDNSSGARDAGSGTGADGQGAGTGAGAGGSGQGGGGVAVKTVKIAGDINSTRDYPPATRELRLGDYVIVALTVGTDGRVKDCRVHRASKDPASDQITCRLAIDRFRFRPATNAAGDPVESIFGWQQRWFEPDEKKRPKEKISLSWSRRRHRALRRP